MKAVSTESQASRTDVSAVLSEIEQAVQQKRLISTAAENLHRWLTEARYSRYLNEVVAHVKQGKWKELDDAFWTIIPFGTGGRRGRMYPIGSNAINDRTIGESARGLAEYVNRQLPTGRDRSCAIAYDTRNNSRHFAELCAGIMVAAGFKVYFLDDYRSTPELSFLVRHRRCDCGIMVTASHNPPSDNAVKVYWNTGGQVLPPHDSGIIDCVMSVQDIPAVPFAEALSEGRIVICTPETDSAFLQAVRQQAFPGPRDLRIIYSPLHGVGESAVCEALSADGFGNVEVFGPHRERSGNFPNVPGHVSNPENPAVFTDMIAQAQATGADLVLATDPDCDRMGCAAPLTLDTRGPWATLNGNQLGALLTDYVLEQRKKAGNLTKSHYVIKTLVTTDMIRRIADSYQVRTEGNIHVGFKWIGEVVDRDGPDQFAFGTEESHGFMVGQYVRDKDGAVACMLMAELAACCKARRQSVHQKLESLYWQHGFHGERLLNMTMPGSQGMEQMRRLMANFRNSPPTSLAGMAVAAVKDYQTLTVRTTSGKGAIQSFVAPKADMVILETVVEGNYVAVRPSGTEPKVKFYMFGFVPAEQLADLDRTKIEMEQRLIHVEQDLKQYAS